MRDQPAGRQQVIGQRLAVEDDRPDAAADVVRVAHLDLDDLEKYEFVGPGEEDYDGPVMKILTTSPIAKGLLGRKVGDVVEVVIPRGSMRLEITEIVAFGD